MVDHILECTIDSYWGSKQENATWFARRLGVPMNDDWIVWAVSRVKWRDRNCAPRSAVLSSDEIGVCWPACRKTFILSFRDYSRQIVLTRRCATPAELEMVYLTRHAQTIYRYVNDGDAQDRTSWFLARRRSTRNQRRRESERPA